MCGPRCITCSLRFPTTIKLQNSLWSYCCTQHIFRCFCIMMVSGKNLLPWFTKLKVVTCEYGSPAQGNGLLAKMKQQKCFCRVLCRSFSVGICQWKMWLSQLVSHGVRQLSGVAVLWVLKRVSQASRSCH